MSETASWVTFGQERYHLNSEMEKWCQNNIGEGGWTDDIPKIWKDVKGKVWVIYSMFGNTTFAFKESKHLSMFLLRWG
jgi:hypothetical protein